MDNRGTPPEMSNFCCLPGRAGGTPILIVSDNSTKEGEGALIYKFLLTQIDAASSSGPDPVGGLFPPPGLDMAMYDWLQAAAGINARLTPGGSLILQ